MLKHKAVRFSLQVFEWKTVDTFRIEKWPTNGHTREKMKPVFLSGSVSEIKNKDSIKILTYDFQFVLPNI